ncbi:hypothetical protein RFI_08698 [Reticulomyxa filosa]|uniref:Protein kinase domain-containing protein n=1 Tax=Reticulomyxa filosa TaxID=46433 RepID=X6NT03_RETFI|nr:hypothetical protein RFI_08698 [Reticulomyxa filosa]|eukprot:ETO28432.1 hypothetical protein RFI_08698 [Reticulomyxa filosa]
MASRTTTNINQKQELSSQSTSTFDLSSKQELMSDTSIHTSNTTTRESEVIRRTFRNKRLNQAGENMGFLHTPMRSLSHPLREDTNDSQSNDDDAPRHLRPFATAIAARAKKGRYVEQEINLETTSLNSEMTESHLTSNPEILPDHLHRQHLQQQQEQQDHQEQQDQPRYPTLLLHQRNDNHAKAHRSQLIEHHPSQQKAKHVNKAIKHYQMSSRQCPLSWKKRLLLLFDIASAMEFLHKKNMLHRDLKVLLFSLFALSLSFFFFLKGQKKKKTANILLHWNPKKKRYVAKVCDFGSARNAYLSNTTQSQLGRSVIVATGGGKEVAESTIISVGPLVLADFSVPEMSKDRTKELTNHFKKEFKSMRNRSHSQSLPDQHETTHLIKSKLKPEQSAYTPSNPLPHDCSVAFFFKKKYSDKFICLVIGV